MNRTGGGYISKKVWGLILLALAVFGGGCDLHPGGAEVGRANAPFFSLPPAKPASGRESAGTGSKGNAGLEIVAFLATRWWIRDSRRWRRFGWPCRWPRLLVRMRARPRAGIAGDGLERVTEARRKAFCFPRGETGFRKRWPPD